MFVSVYVGSVIFFYIFICSATLSNDYLSIELFLDMIQMLKRLM